MKENQHQSLASGAPSQSGDLGESATDREKAQAATASDRVEEASPQHTDANAQADGADVGNRSRADPSVERGMASTGAAAQADASARHATENVPERERTPNR